MLAALIYGAGSFADPPFDPLWTVRDIKVKRIDHVAIAVADRDAAAASSRACSASPRARASTWPVRRPTSPSSPRATSTAASLEVCAPAGNEPASSSSSARGPGLHHVCFEVEDLPAALSSLKAAGVRLIDETPRPGARGHMVAFLHPAATGGVLFELCAAGHGGSSS